MGDVVLGVVALIAGAALCFRGYLAMQILIPIWGLFAGFSFGAGLVAAIAGDGFLATTTGWIVGFGFALVFAVFAYFYYAIAILILMGSAGFVLGSGVMVALGITWNWVLILVGVACGVALAFAAIVIDMPMLVLVVITALAGAMAMTAGFMFLAGALSTEDLTRADIIEQVRDEWWTYAVYLVLAVVGIVSQMRLAQQMHLTMRQAWAAPASGDRV